MSIAYCCKEVLGCSLDIGDDIFLLAACVVGGPCGVESLSWAPYQHA